MITFWSVSEEHRLDSTTTDITTAYLIIDNVIVLSDLVESSGYSSKTLKKGSCPNAPLDEATVFVQYVDPYIIALNQKKSPWKGKKSFLMLISTHIFLSSAHLSIYPSFYPSIYPSIHLFILRFLYHQTPGERESAASRLRLPPAVRCLPRSLQDAESEDLAQLEGWPTRGRQIHHPASKNRWGRDRLWTEQDLCPQSQDGEDTTFIKEWFCQWICIYNIILIW